MDKRSGPIQPKSALSITEQEIICEFRRVTKLPLDDVYISLKDKIPALTRSNLHRCLKRNGLNVLPVDEEKREKRNLKITALVLCIFKKLAKHMVRQTLKGKQRIEPSLFYSIITRLFNILPKRFVAHILKQFLKQLMR
jgi:hypothetical protein